jgi:hypothetical protein
LALTTCIICALTTESLESENADIKKKMRSKVCTWTCAEAGQTHSKVKKKKFGKTSIQKNVKDKELLARKVKKKNRKLHKIKEGTL